MGSLGAQVAWGRMSGAPTDEKSGQGGVERDWRG